MAETVDPSDLHHLASLIARARRLGESLEALADAADEYELGFDHRSPTRRQMLANGVLGTWTEAVAVIHSEAGRLQPPSPE